ncbi:hypothetical protein AX774_g4797 [Zancudomyces culisetae]|uniref:Uncharacterized protein n=1 Tax=Zancudomyces culisetae TaxID=1213189 RepID=A0A1R1PLD4_ZANCU|nr:hypothetical protein AX774_g4797 [Zancudomyces culisetae]|eukprot:OMH81743.1 hypothetical protein AX774_g4797 [Zancudomyces culisetae]
MLSAEKSQSTSSTTEREGGKSGINTSGNSKKKSERLLRPLFLIAQRLYRSMDQQNISKSKAEQRDVLSTLLCESDNNGFWYRLLSENKKKIEKNIPKQKPKLSSNTSHVKDNTTMDQQLLATENLHENENENEDEDEFTKKMRGYSKIYKTKIQIQMINEIQAKQKAQIVREAAEYPKEYSRNEIQILGEEAKANKWAHGSKLEFLGLVYQTGVCCRMDVENPVNEPQKLGSEMLGRAKERMFAERHQISGDGVANELARKHKADVVMSEDAFIDILTARDIKTLAMMSSVSQQGVLFIDDSFSLFRNDVEILSTLFKAVIQEKLINKNSEELVFGGNKGGKTNYNYTLWQFGGLRLLIRYTVQGYISEQLPNSPKEIKATGVIFPVIETNLHFGFTQPNRSSLLEIYFRSYLRGQSLLVFGHFGQLNGQRKPINPLNATLGKADWHLLHIGVCTLSELVELNTYSSVLSDIYTSFYKVLTLFTSFGRSHPRSVFFNNLSPRDSPDISRSELVPIIASSESSKPNKPTSSSCLFAACSLDADPKHIQDFGSGSDSRISTFNLCSELLGFKGDKDDGNVIQEKVPASSTSSRGLPFILPNKNEYSPIVWPSHLLSVE